MVTRSNSQEAALMTVDDVAILINVAPKTIRQWVYRATIPNLKINGVVRFDRSKIEEWCRQSTRADDE